MAKPQTEGARTMTIEPEPAAPTYCCMCSLRGIQRRAAPVAAGLPACVKCRDDATRSSDALRADFQAAFSSAIDSAAVMARYGARLAMGSGEKNG